MRLTQAANLLFPLLILAGSVEAQPPTEMPAMATPGPTAPTPDPTIAPTPFPTIESDINYARNPEVKWSVQLEDTGSILQSRLTDGTAVTVSPEGTLVYVTLGDGRLEVLSASDGSRRWGYEPEPKDDGWKVECRSGVEFGEFQQGGGKYVIYVIIDIAPASALVDNESRIIAISHPSNEVMWISDSIPGEIQGTPVISRSFRFFGLYIFFTHNQRVNFPNDDLVGAFSIVQADNDGALIFTELAGTVDKDPDPFRLESFVHPYGPVGVAAEPQRGRYPGGDNNRNDIIVWATNIDNGTGANGYVRAFQLPDLFRPQFASSVETTFLREVRWNTISKPELSEDGLSLYFGAGRSVARGWSKLNDFNENANLVTQLRQAPDSIRDPIPTSPVLSTAESRLFVAAAGDSFYALSPNNGEVFWQVNSDSLYHLEPRVAPDDNYVYTIQENGMVTAYRQRNGQRAWRLDCSTNIFQNQGLACTDDIRAEFSLSPNGLVLYYGDVFGNVKALQIGTSRSPTDAPTPFPTKSPTSSPSAAPSVVPTAVPSAGPTRGAETNTPSASPSSTTSSAPSQSQHPTAAPTSTPSSSPSAEPTTTPSMRPTAVPSAPPSNKPSMKPVTAPTVAPSTAAPVTSPSAGPGDRSAPSSASQMVLTLSVVSCIIASVLVW